jgi:hypothetical protein
MFMQVQEMEEKLNKLQSGVILVKPEDKKIIEESFSEKVTQWRKRKKMFKELWDNITENSPKDQKEFKVIFPLFLPFHLILLYASFDLSIWQAGIGGCLVPLLSQLLAS